VRKLKLLVATLATTLLFAAPALAQGPDGIGGSASSGSFFGDGWFSVYSIFTGPGDDNADDGASEERRWAR
jgi:hypothetical protein